MNLTMFIQKFKTNFPFRKKVLIIWVLVVVALIWITVVGKNGGWLFARVMPNLTDDTGVAIRCTDTDSGLNYYVKWSLLWGFVAGTKKTIDRCNGNVLNEYTCQKNWTVVTYTCPDGCSDWACTSIGTWYGYGYGYSRTGWIYSYGYGYGYQKIDPKTNKPWMYLLIPFKTYSKAVYDTVIQKIGFKMVKSYNKKEFTAPTKNMLAPASRR